jgi:hypothetical protein
MLNTGDSSTWINLGDGTFFIQSHFSNPNDGQYHMATELRQGIGVTFPSGPISGFILMEGFPTPVPIQKYWSEMATGSYPNSGYAIKLSGITSGGVDSGGGFGGGLQPL